MRRIRRARFVDCEDEIDYFSNERGFEPDRKE